MSDSFPSRRPFGNPHSGVFQVVVQAFTKSAIVALLPDTSRLIPSRNAIFASVHPAQGTALYFVAKGDGSHYFSATLAEHNAAVRQYQSSKKP